MAVASSLCGCGGGGGGGSAIPQSIAPALPRNHAPTIAGRPLLTVLQGTQYGFTPIASDADDDALTFAASGLPAWAKIDATTGRVSGSPAPADVGTSGSVSISVSDGIATVTLPAFAIEVVATATGAASLSWLPPTENDDGTPLTDLAGYKIYWGVSVGDYPNVVEIKEAGLTRYLVEQLTPAKWFFVVTAVNSGGVESEVSNLSIRSVR
jgi:hypothetical protein